MRRTGQQRGYLLVLVAVVVSMLTISFLRLAASSAQTDDDAEAEVSSQAAFYAAESGLLVAEMRLRDLKASPPAGSWLKGTLDRSGALYSVEVVPEEKGSKTRFTLRSTGTADTEGGKKLLSVLEATVSQGAGKRWTVLSRKRSART